MQMGFGDCQVELSSKDLGLGLRDCNALLGDGPALRERMAEDGYLLVRGLHDREAVLRARRAVVGFLEGAAASEEEGEVDARIVPGRVMPRTLGVRAITHQADVRAVLEGEPILRFFETYFGEPVVTFDYKWLRAVGTGDFTGSHYDVVYMRRGSSRLHTCWTPFGRVGPELGSLAICVGSHRLASFERLRETYGRSDADRDGYGGWFNTNPLEITRQFGGEWHTTTFEPGDAIIFGMYTLHASTNNMTDRWRISCDTRFQPASEPVDPRWIGDQPLPAVNTGPAVATDALRRQWGLGLPLADS